MMLVVPVMLMVVVIVMKMAIMRMTMMMVVVIMITKVTVIALGSSLYAFHAFMALRSTWGHHPNITERKYSPRRVSSSPIVTQLVRGKS